MRSGPKTHHVFLERQQARRCLSALSPLNKCRQQRGSAHCGGFPRAEHADLGKQSPHTQTEAITLGGLIEQDLAEQLCFGVLYLSSLSQICTVWGSPVRAYADWEWMHSWRRVKDPEPDIIFISSMVDYMACCSLTAALISGRYGRIY